MDSLLGTLSNYDTFHYFPHRAKVGLGRATHHAGAMGYRDEACRKVRSLGITRCTSCPLPDCTFQETAGGNKRDL